MSSARRHRPAGPQLTAAREWRRIAAIVLVAAALGGGAAAAEVAGSHPPRVTLQPAALASQGAPVGSQSSSWYCAGGTGTANPRAQPALLLVNSGTSRVAGTIDVVDTKGASARLPFTVPAGGQVAEVPGPLVPGAWLAARVEADGGGITASEVVDGPTGQAAAPCASETSPRWYFAQGTTAEGASLHVSLFNPTAELAVVNLTFVTAGGLVSPPADQGLVVGPGRLVTVTVGTYVQHKAEVATIVSARSGSVVAAELQLFDAHGVEGTALALGAPAPAPTWAIPRSIDIAGGTSGIDVLNASTVTEHVRVAVRVPSEPAAYFEQVIGPESVWTLPTSAQLRIPVGVDYSVQVTATGGPGVVVGRTGAGTATSPSPQWGSVAGVAEIAASVPGRWIVPETATLSAAAPVTGTSGTAPVHASVATTGVVVLENLSGTIVRTTVSKVTADGARRVDVVLLAANGTVTVAARRAPLLVEADGPLAIEAVSSPPEAPGFVSVPALAQT